MSSLNYVVRTMTRDELDIAVDWAAAEGWNPGLYDADSFYAADPSGFLIGKLNNEPIATISVVKYGETFGFLGFYIVKPEYRGKGYGIDIWNKGLQYLKGRNIGLDGVVDQQENYKKSGFKLTYRNIRYEGISGGKPFESSKIKELSSLSFDTIESYDRPFFPENRSKFIQSWIKLPKSNALGVMQDGKLAGYGVIRKCITGYKIGPLFANNFELAELLFLALKARVKPMEPVYLDIPETNHKAVDLVDQYNMKFVFETARMYTGKNPDILLNNLFGVTSFELG